MAIKGQPGKKVPARVDMAGVRKVAQKPPAVRTDGKTGGSRMSQLVPGAGAWGQDGRGGAFRTALSETIANTPASYERLVQSQTRKVA